MKNFNYSGETIEFTAGADVASGDVVVIGELIGVAGHDVKNGEVGSADLEGVFSLPKAVGALTRGQKLFWDKVALKFTATPSGDADTVRAYAFEDAANGDASVLALLCCCGVAPKVVAAVADEATVNGSDAASTQALANALKTKLNALLAAMRAAGVLDQ